MATAYSNALTLPSVSYGSKLRRSEHTRLHEAVKAISVCHNVTPTYEDSTDL